MQYTLMFFRQTSKRQDLKWILTVTFSRWNVSFGPEYQMKSWALVVRRGDASGIVVSGNLAVAEMSNLTDAASWWEGGESRAVGLCKMKLILSDWDYIKSTFKMYFILSLSLAISLTASPHALCFFHFFTRDILNKKEYNRFYLQALMFSPFILIVILLNSRWTWDFLITCIIFMCHEGAVVFIKLTSWPFSHAVKCDQIF